MKLFFEDKIISWLDSFDVFDEIGRILFHVEHKPGCKRLKIYDRYFHNKSVATLKESDDEFPAVEIKHGTRFVSIVRKVCGRLRTAFDLGFLNWRAVGDFDCGSFRILDDNHRTVAAVGETFCNHAFMRVIDTLPEYTLHSLTFTLAVDLQVTEPVDSKPAVSAAAPVPAVGTSAPVASAVSAVSAVPSVSAAGPAASQLR